MRRKLLSLLIVLMLCVICTVSITMAAVEKTDTTPAETTKPVTIVPTASPIPLYQNVTTQTLVVSVPPGTPEIPPFLNYLDLRTRSNRNSTQGTPPIETGSMSDSETYVFVTEWGTYGSGKGQFRNPWGVTVDSSDNVYVVDYGNNRIQKFSSDGTFLMTWGASLPSGVAVDSSGNVYVTDMGNNRIQKFSSDGTFLMTWGTNGTGDGQFMYPGPIGVAADSSGNIYVSDQSNNRIQKFSCEGTYLMKWGSEGSGDGQFWSPRGIVADSLGNVYVTEYPNNRIQKFSSDGTFLTKWGSYGSGAGKFKSPEGIAVDSSGNFYVTDIWNYRIQKFSSTGLYLTQWGSEGSGDGEFYQPYGVAVDSSGNVYVTDMGNNRIQKFARESPLVANFIATPTSGNAPLTVKFTDSSTGFPTSWSWDFGDGSSVNSTEQHPVHTYVSNGTYTVSLNATNSAGSNTFTRTNYITVGSGQGQYIFTEQQNGATVYLNPTNTITLKLEDNPSTGYSWNMATTDGLQVTGNSFQSSDTTGRLNGAGGIHSWNMTVVGTGEQKISGIYSRSWEPVTGNENRFDMTIIVV